jgi:hypothetical protein
MQRLLYFLGFWLGQGLAASTPKAVTFRQRLEEQAIASTTDFYSKNMRDAWLANGRESIWTDGLRRSDTLEGGLILEFGVWRGDSLRFLAEHNPDQVVYGFDSFEGLAEDWLGVLPAGFFALDKPPNVAVNAQLVVGLVQETLPRFLDENRGVVRYVHLDLDTFQSTLDVLRLLRGRFAAGTVLVFDEFFGFPQWEQGEAEAWRQFVSDTSVEFRYFATNGMVVGVQITKNPADDSMSPSATE